MAEFRKIYRLLSSLLARPLSSAAITISLTRWFNFY